MLLCFEESILTAIFAAIILLIILSIDDAKFIAKLAYDTRDPAMHDL